MKSNPFDLIVPTPKEGLGLNPILQDPLLVVHPPFLYLGYVGFSLTLSLVLAAIITKQLDSTWAKISWPWVVVSWVFLTIGISLGSIWAYYELGWGGYWFWDPVENASLMPWLASTALIHSLLVLKMKNKMQNWTALLAIMTFSLSLLGTFLVRSGILNSVHAFANDPDRGVFILVIVILNPWNIGTTQVDDQNHAEDEESVYHLFARPVPAQDKDKHQTRENHPEDKHANLCSAVCVDRISHLCRNANLKEESIHFGSG